MKKYIDPYMIIQRFGHESVMTGSAGSNNVDAALTAQGIDVNDVPQVNWGSLTEPIDVIHFN